MENNKEVLTRHHVPEQAREATKHGVTRARLSCSFLNEKIIMLKKKMHLSNITFTVQLCNIELMFLAVTHSSSSSSVRLSSPISRWLSVCHSSAVSRLFVRHSSPVSRWSSVRHSSAVSRWLSVRHRLPSAVSCWWLVVVNHQRRSATLTLQALSITSCELAVGGHATVINPRLPVPAIATRQSPVPLVSPQSQPRVPLVSHQSSALSSSLQSPSPVLSPSPNPSAQYSFPVLSPRPPVPLLSLQSSVPVPRSSRQPSVPVVSPQSRPQSLSSDLSPQSSVPVPSPSDLSSVPVPCPLVSLESPVASLQSAAVSSC